MDLHLLDARPSAVEQEHPARDRFLAEVTGRLPKR